MLITNSTKSTPCGHCAGDQLFKMIDQNAHTVNMSGESVTLWYILETRPFEIMRLW